MHGFDGPDAAALHFVDLGFTVLYYLLALGCLVAVGGLVVAAWRGTGVDLRPDGLVNREPPGTLSVPWEAIDPGLPLPFARVDRLGLRYVRPELVRRRGLAFRHSVACDSVDSGFLGRAIRYYLDNPGARAAIGTEAGYRDLLDSLDGADLRSVRQ